MPTNITVSTISNEIVVDPSTNVVSVNETTQAVTVTPQVSEVSVNKTTQEIFVNTRTNKADIGLGNVDNTSDLDKPISTATKLYVDTEIDYLTTADIEENGNLYFTNARADARVAAGIAAIDFPVDSVNGQTGAVSLTTTNIAEGTNLYYTQARVDARFSELVGDLNFPVTSVNGQTGVVTLDTDDISEGTTNKYFTDARADARVAAGLVGYATETYADTVAGTAEANAKSYADVVAAAAATSANGYTDSAISAIDFPVDSVNGKTQTVILDTDDIAEGTTNLYYTDTRVESYLTTNNYATQAYAVSAANSAVAAVVDSAPETLDTLNELAAALADDPNFATTITTQLGNKLDTADFGAAFDASLAGKTTDDLNEGTTNQYFTVARSRNSISASGDLVYDSVSGVISYTTPPAPVSSVNGQTGAVVLDTDDISEGTTNKYFTQTNFDTAFAGKTTTDLAEGTNLYYTDSRFDTRLATKTTTDLAEGTNLYYTDDRVNTFLTDGSVSSINFGGNTSLSWNADDVTLEFPVNADVTLQIGQENLIKVKNLSGATLENGTVIRVTGAQGSNMTVDKADNTNDTVSADTIAVMTQSLNNNGVGFATTQGLVRGLNTSAYAEGAVLWLGSNGTFTTTKPLTPLHLVQVGYVVRSHATEGTVFVHINNGWELEELHDVLITSVADGDTIAWDATNGYWKNVAGGSGSYTDADARAAVTNGTDLALDGTDVYVKTLRDATHTLGTHIISYDPNATPLEPTSGLLDGTSSLDVFSSPGGPTGKGYGVAASLNYFAGDTLAGINTAPAFAFRAATGPSTAPTATVANQVVGTINSGTYATTDWSSIIATDNAGGGKTVFHPLQYQFYATQDVTESTFNLTTTSATQSNLTISSVVSSGNGVFTNTSTDIRPYDVVRVFGTLTGTMSFPGYVSGNLYRVIAGGNPTTTFTLSNVYDGDPISTTAGTTTGLTFQKCRTLFNAPVGSNGSYFGTGAILTATGFTPSGMNGTFRVIYYNSSTGQTAVGNYQASGNATVQGSITGGAVIQGGMGYRVRAFPDNRYYNINNRVNLIDHNATTATYRSDTHIWQGATNTYQYLNLNAAGGSFNVGTMTIKDLTGANTYFSSGILATKTFTPFRYNLTAGGNFAAGSTYTPASSVTNAISATINSGASATFTIAVTNLKASATEGGHYQISVTNTSGADQTVTTSGCNTNPSLVLTNGSSCVVTIYVVGTLAFGEILS